MNRRQFFGSVTALACRSGVDLKSRLGVTGDEIAPDLETALKVLRELGLGWIELRNVWGKYVTDLPLAECRRARGLLDRAGVKVSVLDTALFKCDLPGVPSGRKEDYRYSEQEALLARALERAPIFGTRFVRVFSFWRGPAGSPTEPVVEHLEKATRVAKAAGCVLLLENVNGANVETSAESARVLAAVPSAHLGLCWDPNNALCGGDRPFPDGYARLDRERLHHVHLRDAARDADGKHCRWLPVGQGQVDNLGLLRALKRDGYTGTLTLETHYQRPDKNKELATRESMAGLLKVLERV
jgi:L-ribulose-5-phosphate 3-epimerase